MSLLIATVLAAASATAQDFPTCATVNTVSGWVETTDTGETSKVRRVAEKAGVLDPGVSWGQEHWYRDASFNYLLCSNDCAADSLSITYEVRFLRQRGTWLPQWMQAPACAVPAG